MDVSFIIVNWNTKDLLLNCISSIYQTVRGPAFEIWLVDNASSDESIVAAKSAYPAINIIENEENLGFAAANNLALRRMNGRYALLLNTDTSLTENAARELYEFMEATPKAAIACGQLLNLDGSKQNSIANPPSLLSLLSNETILRLLLPKKFPSKRKQYTAPIEINSCVGACMIVRKEAIDKAGYFDERFFFFLEETDWALRMKRGGWKLYFIPTAGIFHAQGQSVGSGVEARIMFYRSRYIFFKKWNPNLYPIICFAVLSRLIINALLSLLGLVFTLGLSDDLNRRSAIYMKLLTWHVRGCP